MDSALRLATQIASALEAAHALGIFHRDLKPANVLVTASGDAKLLDFGIAKRFSTDADVTRTVEGTVLGTAAYMSPEQAEGRAVDARSDIFSFGAVIYELISGRRAFDGATTSQVITAVLRDEPPALQTSSVFTALCHRKGLAHGRTLAQAGANDEPPAHSLSLRARCSTSCQLGTVRHSLEHRHALCPFAIPSRD